MKIQYCSDLHLEFKRNKEFLLANPLKPTGEILLLAGDIVPLAALEQHKDFFNFVADNFEYTYWIAGNHEYYHYDLGKKTDPLLEKIRSNVLLVNNQTIRYKEVNLICTTLWSDIKPLHEWEVEQSVSDFYLIKYNGTKLTAGIFNQLHQDCRNFLQSALKENEGQQNIVMTHHVPTMLHYPVYFRNSPINDAFAVEMQDFILESDAAYWLYGHHHCNVADFTIGHTNMITNQLGYVHENQHRKFRADAVVEL
jgi:predicted phosphohydrolase